MQIECSSADLLAAVKRAMPAVAPPRGSVSPVLSCVLVRGVRDRITVSATDTEIGITTDVAEASCGEAGCVVVPADQLAAVLSEIDDDVILRTQDGQGTARLSATGVFFDFATCPADEFPEFMLAGDGGQWFDLTGDTLRSMIRRTAFAVAARADGARYAMRGVLVEREGPRVHLVATDSKRLAVATSGVVASGDATDTDPKKPHIVPTKVLAAVERVAEGTTLVRVHLYPNRVTCETPGWSMTAALIEGRFPPYRDIIQKAGATQIINLDAAEFAGSVRRAAVMTDQERRRIDFTFGAALATLKASRSKGGEGEVIHPCPGFSGPSVEVALDPAYVLDWFKVIGAGPVALELAGAEQPVLFKSGDAATYLVMALAG